MINDFILCQACYGKASWHYEPFQVYVCNWCRSKCLLEAEHEFSMYREIDHKEEKKFFTKGGSND